jgi:Cu2+-containing amine oxidase
LRFYRNSLNQFVVPYGGNNNGKEEKRCKEENCKEEKEKIA